MLLARPSYATDIYRRYSTLLKINLLNYLIFQSTDLNLANHVHTEQVSDIGYKVQAVLVEEDEDEDVEEHEENKPEKQPHICAVAMEPAEAEVEEAEEEEREEDKEASEKEDETQEKVLHEKVVHEKEEKEEENVEGFKDESEPVLLDESTEMEQNKEEAEDDETENNKSGDGQPHADFSEFLEEEEESEISGSLHFLVFRYLDYIILSSMIKIKQNESIIIKCVTADF